MIAISESELNNIVSESESLDGVQVQVTVPESTEAGDLLTLVVTNLHGTES